MKTRDFAAKFIRFDKASPISGAFDLSKYPFLGAPMDTADDIECKRLVIYKASSCMGTVLGQIINSKRIVCDVGDQKMVCQTDDDAEKWSKTRGKEWLRSIPDAMRLLSSEQHAITNSLWLFRHKFLEISGPGINSAQSVQVRYLQTDESHLEAYGPGRLVEFEKRLGGRFDRQATHITTAADEGKEVDQLFKLGSQNEWHWRCPKCASLVWPLWVDDSKEFYNGHIVLDNFGDSIVFSCPNCSYTAADTARNRYELTRDGDYVAKNPRAPKETQSFRWSSWAAAHWMEWKTFRIEYESAMERARLGDIKPFEDFTKKRKCKSWVPVLPDTGETRVSNYKAGEVWITNEAHCRICSFDFQEGKGADGVHWWGQVDEFSLNGDSRRIDFRRLESWADCRALQLHHNVNNSDTFCDAGHRSKEVFAHCAAWKWYALISTDKDEFTHKVKVNGEEQLVTNPYYTQTKLQDSMSGKHAEFLKRRGVILARGPLPEGWCYSRTWSKPNIGFLLLRLKDGRLGREYGIASDLIEEYSKQLNSYIESESVFKSTGRRERVLKQVSDNDHAFATSSQNLLGSIIRGFFPVSSLTL